MIDRLTIQFLSENTAARSGILAEHGLALWIEADDRRILFDTGQGLALRHNAKVMGVDLSTADTLIFSHGHFDHTDGFPTARECFAHARAYAHPAAFRERFSLHPPEPPHPVGPAMQSPDDVGKYVKELILTKKSAQLGNGIWLTGQVPRTHAVEDVGGAFFLDRDGTVPDAIEDDQSLCIETNRGLVVVLGCCHSGVMNTLDHIDRLSGGKRIHTVLGGMHLHSASRERLDQTIAALRERNVAKVGPCHCTGFRPAAAMLAAWEDGFQSLGAGATWTPDEAAA